MTDSARLPVSVVIPTLDEAARIGGLVRSLGWADEVLVVDGGSRDATRELAREAGATVLELVGRTIGAQRNLGIDRARNEWVLAIDADEAATPELVRELAGVLAAPASDAYRIRRRVSYLGREVAHGRWARDWPVRLFRRRYRYTEVSIHERLGYDGRSGRLHGTLLHEPYRDLRHHLTKMIGYTRAGAEELAARGVRATAWQLMAHPTWRFLREYLVYGAWREGRFGLLTAGLSGITAFLKYAHLLALEFGTRHSSLGTRHSALDTRPRDSTSDN